MSRDIYIHSSRKNCITCVCECAAKGDEAPFPLGIDLNNMHSRAMRELYVT